MNITDTNLSALTEAINESPDGIIRRVEAASANHIRRCITAELLERTSERVGRGYAWKLTAAGQTAVAEYTKFWTDWRNQ